MSFEGKPKEIVESEVEISRHELARHQKLTLADIRQAAPDSIKIVYVSGNLRPKRHFAFILIKGDKKNLYKDEELDLSTGEWATLKEEFEVNESTIEGTPSPATMALAEREWEEWEKINGPRPRFRDSPEQ